MTSLARFHQQVAHFLKGEITAEEFAARVGPSPSGLERLMFYRTLMRRNVALILGQLHGATRVAAERHRSGLWTALIREYTRVHPPDHCDPGHFGERLSAFLAARRAEDPSLPAYLEEVADYQWCCYAVGVAPFEPTRQDIGLDRTLFVRQYDHATPAFVRAALRDEVDPAEPELKSTPVLIYRHPQTLRAKVYYPSPLGLAVVARSAGRAVALEGVAAERLDSVERELRNQGVLPA